MNLIFDSLVIVSPTERKARIQRFHPRTNLIIGKNRTGKSTLLKTIFWTFGANPKKYDRHFYNDELLSCIYFHIGHEEFMIARRGKRFVLYPRNGQAKVFDGITRGIGPALAELVGFKLKLVDRKGESLTAPPQYYFMPYYIDQDSGWEEPWSSFDGSMIANWKKDVSYYHTGVYDNQYFDTKAHIQEIRPELEESNKKRKVLEGAVDSVGRNFETQAYSLDEREFEEMVASYSDELAGLGASEDNYREEMRHIVEEVDRVSRILNIAKTAMATLQKGIDHIVDDGNRLVCPTCSAEYKAGISEHFEYAYDVDYCRSTMQKCTDSLHDLTVRKQELRGELDQIAQKQEQLRILLSRSVGPLTIDVHIENIARQKAMSTLDDEIKSTVATIVEIETRLSKLHDVLKQYESSNRRRAYTQELIHLYERACTALNVDHVPRITQITSKINSTGSNLSRSVLAYKSAVLSMIHSHGQTAIAPFVVDSPRKDEQDTSNFHDILRHIIGPHTAFTQVIVATVDPETHVKPNNTIRLDETNALLGTADYDAVQPLMNRISGIMST